MRSLLKGLGWRELLPTTICCPIMFIKATLAKIDWFLLRKSDPWSASLSLINHLWLRHYSAVKRSWGLTLSMHLIKSRQSLLKSLRVSSIWGTGLSVLFMCSTSFAVVPLNRELEVNTLKNRLPILNMSAFVVKGSPLSTSGATYPGVPHLNLRRRISSTRQASPRSDMQSFKSVLSIKRMLSGFRSLWIIFFLCIKSTLSKTYAIIVRA